MKINKTHIFIAAVVFQIAVFAFTICKAKSVVKEAAKNGQIYTFETNVYDPRDVMKGRYVQLTFNESMVLVDNLDEESKSVKLGSIPVGKKLYAVIKADENGIAHISGLREKIPQDQTFITVKFKYFYQQEEKKVSLDFNFDRFYLQEEHADFIDKVRSSEHPMHLEVYIDDRGNIIQKELYLYDEELGYIPAVEFIKKANNK